MLLKIFRKKSLELASMDNTDTHSSTGLKKRIGGKGLNIYGGSCGNWCRGFFNHW